MKISTRIFSKSGNVLAPDAQWTGEEPIWKGWESWSVERFMRMRMRMLPFYSYYTTSSDLKPDLLSWMKEQKYPKTDIDVVNSIAPNSIPLTLGKLARVLNRGMPSLHPKAAEYYKTLSANNGIDNDGEIIPLKPIDDAITLHKEIQTLLNQNKPASIETKVKAVVTKVVKKDTEISSLEKVDTDIISYIEQMFDNWMRDFEKTKVQPLSLVSFVRDGNIKKSGIAYLLSYLNKHLEEFRGAYEKSDLQLVEGYSYLGKAALRNRVTLLQEMINEVTRNSLPLKKARVIKKDHPKQKDPSKLITRLKFAVENDVLNIKSIDPIAIIGSKTLYVYNTKYRTLTVYFASDDNGHTISGTSLKNFDEQKSYVITLRKPKEILNYIITQAPKKIESTLFNIDSKKKMAKGRLNENTILLRAEPI